MKFSWAFIILLVCYIGYLRNQSAPVAPESVRILEETNTVYIPSPPKIIVQHDLTQVPVHESQPTPLPQPIKDPNHHSMYELTND